VILVHRTPDDNALTDQPRQRDTRHCLSGALTLTLARVAHSREMLPCPVGGNSEDE
jgi:hypothetical protein